MKLRGVSHPIYLGGGIAVFGLGGMYPCFLNFVPQRGARTVCGTAGGVGGGGLGDVARDVPAKRHDSFAAASSTSQADFTHAKTPPKIH